MLEQSTNSLANMSTHDFAFGSSDASSHVITQVFGRRLRLLGWLRLLVEMSKLNFSKLLIGMAEVGHTTEEQTRQQQKVKDECVTLGCVRCLPCVVDLLQHVGADGRPEVLSIGWDVYEQRGE